MVTGIHEECGVFGIYTNKTSDVAAQTYVSLYALQHRGQESCGIVVNDDGVFSYHKDVGLVNQVFDKETLERLGKGNIAIGHVRYSTTGNCNASNAQPLVVRHIKGPMAIAHNGNLTNARELREQYENKGMIFHSTNDTEVISYTITEERLREPSIQAALEKANVTDANISASDLCNKLKAVMTEITVDGVTGSMTWNAEGEPTKEPKAMYIQDGAYKAMD